MLYDFIRTHRDEIIGRIQLRVDARPAEKPSEPIELEGLPIFLDQLGEALQQARTTDTIDHEQLGQTARRHGHDLLRTGLTVGQVVHTYGDVCQVITELAVEHDARIDAHDFRVLNLCLDDAIAAAVSEYAHHRETAIEAKGTERLGVLAHEMRNFLNTAILSFEVIKQGRVAPSGSTAAMLGRALIGLRDLIDRSLADVRLDAVTGTLERLSVAEIIEEVEIGSTIQARAQAIHFKANVVDPAVCIQGDRQLVVAALANLLQNAFKFTHMYGHVSLTTVLTPDRVLFEVEDECGGLPPGKAEDLFEPFEQRSANRSGLGLGLSICRRAAKANGGELRVRDLPGKGCVFTLDLPRSAPAPLTLVRSNDHGSDAAGQSPVAAGDSDPTRTRSVASA